MTTPGALRRSRQVDPPVPRTYALLRQILPAGRDLRFALDPQSIVEGGGVGGWEEVPHPYRPSTTRWNGQPLKTLGVAVLFDGWREQRSVEEECRIIAAFARPQANTPSPPVMSFLWGSYSALQWVINDLQWGDELRGRDGVRVRQQVTITLLEHRADSLSVIDPRPVAAAPSKGAQSPSKTTPKASGRTYTVRSGDTGGKIAQTQLGKASRWPEIAKLNGIRDLNLIRVGQVLRLPA